MTSISFVAIESESENDEAEDEVKDFPFLLMECLRLLIENNPINTKLFHQHGGSKHTFEIIPYFPSRQYALRVVEQMIVDGRHDELGKYFKMLFYFLRKIILLIVEIP